MGHLKLLLVCQCYPYPTHSGDRSFVAGIIETLAADDSISLTVFCGAGLPTTGFPLAGVRWLGNTCEPSWTRDLRSLISRYPRQAVRAINGNDIRAISRLIAEESFTAIVLSEACTAPVTEVLRKNTSPNPPLIYVSHNVDAVIRPAIARTVKNPLRRILQTLDAYKYPRIEHHLVAVAAGITAVSEEDLSWYQLKRLDLKVGLLKPAYSGKRIAEREIDASVPMVAVLVGSFFWNAKQRNLEDLLGAYVAFSDTLTPGAGFKLRVAGQMPEAFQARLQREFPTVEFVGGFQDVMSVLHDARLALILERLGGGFKLKMLDYVFHRVPILGFSAAMAGSGLRPGEDYLAVADFGDAMEVAGKTIRDQQRLNSLQNSAFARLRSDFDWASRGSVLRAVIGDAVRRHQPERLSAMRSGAGK